MVFEFEVTSWDCVKPARRTLVKLTPSADRHRKRKAWTIAITDKSSKRHRKNIFLYLSAVHTSWTTKWCLNSVLTDLDLNKFEKEEIEFDEKKLTKYNLSLSSASQPPKKVWHQKYKNALLLLFLLLLLLLYFSKKTIWQKLELRAVFSFFLLSISDIRSTTKKTPLFTAWIRDLDLT